MNTDQTASKQSDLGTYCLKYIVHIRLSNACKIFNKTYCACSRINVWLPNMCKQTLQALIQLLVIRVHTVCTQNISQWDGSSEDPKYIINFWIKIITNLRWKYSLIWTYACNQRNLCAICQQWRVILIAWWTPATPLPPLKIVFILTNSTYPEQLPPYGVFHLGLHCLPKYLFIGIQNEQKRVNIVYYICKQTSR